MTGKELELAQQLAEVKGDINAMRIAITDLLETFGISGESLEGAGEFKAKLPSILNKLTRKVLMNDFNDQAITNLVAVMPIMKKYTTSETTERTEPIAPKKTKEPKIKVTWKW